MKKFFIFFILILFSLPVSAGKKIFDIYGSLKNSSFQFDNSYQQLLVDLRDDVPIKVQLMADETPVNDITKVFPNQYTAGQYPVNEISVHIDGVEVRVLESYVNFVDPENNTYDNFNIYLTVDLSGNESPEGRASIELQAYAVGQDDYYTEPTLPSDYVLSQMSYRGSIYLMGGMFNGYGEIEIDSFRSSNFDREDPNVTNKYELELYKIDDYLRVTIINDVYPDGKEIANVGFGYGPHIFDFSYLVASGINYIDFSLINSAAGGGYTVGWKIKVDGEVVNAFECGEIGVFGCNNNDLTQGIVYTERVIISLPKDQDEDGILDVNDNCPSTPNPDQADIDNDMVGDACDSDNDNDNVVNNSDNCEFIKNSGQEDTDRDGHGDVCDDDDDNDTIPDLYDNCPLDSNSGQENSDGQGAGDACLSLEEDIDSDKYQNEWDNCPTVANASQYDFDADGLGDACDSDTDNDGVLNEVDGCPETLVGSMVTGAGCTLQQHCPCDNPRNSSENWKNHGQYVSCVAQAVNWFRKNGMMDQPTGDTVSEAAQNSSCGY